MKSAFGIIRAVVPVLYWGGLFYYFASFGSVDEIVAMGLGPTVLGLGVVGLLFCIPLIMKITRLFAGPRSPGSGGKSGPDAPEDDDKNGFDADAAIARYLAWRSAEAASSAPAASPGHRGGPPAARPSFGRKSR